jgi:hypothetical protein
VAVLTPVSGPPILAIQDGYIVVAATVTAHVRQNGKAFLQVATWEAGRGQEVLWLTPGDFETWRRSFTRPTVTD